MTIIAVEGINRVGKTTLLRRLPGELRQHGYNVRATHEFDCPIGRALQDTLSQDGLSPETRVLLHAAIRLDSVRQNQPLLDAGTTLLYDRYLWSSLAYHHPECAQDFLLEANRLCPRADLNIVLDADPQKLLERTADSKLGQQYVDDLERQKLARLTYLDLVRAFPEQAVTGDALRDPDKLLDDIVWFVRHFLDNQQKATAA